MGGRETRSQRGEQGKRERGGEETKGKLKRRSREQSRRADRVSVDNEKGARCKGCKTNMGKERETEKHTAVRKLQIHRCTYKGQYNATKQKYPHCDSLAHIFTHQRPPYLSFLALA